MPAADTSTAVSFAPGDLTPTGAGAVMISQSTTDGSVNTRQIKPAHFYTVVNQMLARLTETPRADIAPVTAEDLRTLATILEGRESPLPRTDVLASVLRDAASVGAMNARAFAALLYVIGATAAGTVTTPVTVGPETIVVHKDTVFSPLGTVFGADPVNAAVIQAPMSSVPADGSMISALGSPLGNTTVASTWPWWAPWAIGGGALLLVVVIGVAIYMAARKKKAAQLEAPEKPGRANVSVVNPPRPQLPRSTRTAAPAGAITRR